ncbi:TPA: zinc-ribbon domain-containing protein [Bacillus toyonensis]
MENSLAIRNPELAKQWHKTKNGKLTPFHVTVGSNKEENQYFINIVMNIQFI